MIEDAIRDLCLTFRELKLKKDIDDLIVFVMKDRFKGIEILKALISYQKINVVVVIPERDSYTDLLQFFDRFKVDFAIATFPEWNFDLLPYVLTVKKLHQIGVEPKRIINLSTERNVSYFLHKNLSELPSGTHFKENLADIDRMNLSILNQFLSMNSQMKWDKECCFVEDYLYLLKLFSSYPFQQLLNRSLKIPNKYHNLITPRCSPKDALERLFGYIKPKINDKKKLYILFVSINTEEEIDKLKNNVKYYTEGDIMIFNSGDIKNINLKDIGCSFYYLVPPETKKENVWLSSFSQDKGIKLEDYSNVIFSTENFYIESDIEKFLERSNYKDLSFLRNKEGLSDYLFSIVSEDIQPFLKAVVEESKDKFEIQKVFKKMNFVSMWVENSTEDENEIVLEYNMVDLDDGSDFPLIIED